MYWGQVSGKIGVLPREDVYTLTILIYANDC